MSKHVILSHWVSGFLRQGYDGNKLECEGNKMEVSIKKIKELRMTPKFA